MFAAPDPPHPERCRIEGDRLALQALRQPMMRFKSSAALTRDIGLDLKVLAETFLKYNESVWTMEGSV